MDWKHPKRWFRISLVAVLLWFSLTQIIVVVKATHVCVTHVWAWFRNGELGLAFWFFVVGAIILFGAINAVPWILNRRGQMLKNSKLQMLLGGIVLGGLLAFGIFLFASPAQRAYAHGDCATRNDILNMQNAISLGTVLHRRLHSVFLAVSFWQKTPDHIESSARTVGSESASMDRPL